MSGSSSAMRIRYAMVSVSFAVVLVFTLRLSISGCLWVRNLSRFSISLEILFFIYFSIFVPFIFVVRTTVLRYNDYRIILSGMKRLYERTLHAENLTRL